MAIDYSRIPLAQVSDVASRLAFYRASGCAVVPAAAEAEAAELDSAELDTLPNAPSRIGCTEWEPLPVRNDRAAQQLLVQLAAVGVNAAAHIETGVQSPPALQESAARMYLPLVAGGASSRARQRAW